MKKILLATVAIVGFAGTATGFTASKEIDRLKTVISMANILSAKNSDLHLTSKGSSLTAYGQWKENGFIEITQKEHQGKYHFEYYCLVNPIVTAIRCTDSFSAFVSTYEKDAKGNWSPIDFNGDENNWKEENKFKWRTEYSGNDLPAYCTKMHGVINNQGDCELPIE